MPVHNHGTEDGPGLACKETRQPDGSLRGACLPTKDYAKEFAADMRAFISNKEKN